MSDFVSNNETVQCNCWENLNYATITFLNEEGNNNFININGVEGNNNNTIVIIHQINSGSISDESNRDKAVQTNPREVRISQSVLESETAAMEDGRDYLNNSPFEGDINGQLSSKGVQTNNFEMATPEEFKANNDGTDSITNNNNVAAPQTEAASDEQTVDNNKEENKSILENPQISEILNQSERNKALINSVMKKFSGDMFNFNKNSPNKNQMLSLRDKNPVNQSALKHFLDIMRRESVEKEADKKTTVDGFSQTENVINHKNIQTVAKNTPRSKYYLKKCSLNLGPIGKDFTEFLRQSIKYFEEYQNKVNNLYREYGIDIDEEEGKFDSASRLDQGANAGNISQLAPKVASILKTANGNVGINGNGGHTVIAGNDVNVKDTGNGDGIGNPRAVRGIGGGNYADGGSANGAVTNNNDKAYNTVNPIPRQEQAFGSDQIPIMQAPRPHSGNGSTQVRAAGSRQRNDLPPSARYTPYPRFQHWHQDDPRRRPPPHTYECENAQAVHYQNNQHNTMMRQFNGWQAPNAPNNQVFFPGHHHYHHQF